MLKNLMLGEHKVVSRSLSSVLVLLLSLAPVGAEAYEGSYADAEVHMVDFFQRTQGAKQLIANMDRARITDAIVFGLPVVKKWSLSEPKQPRYVFGDDSPVYYYGMTDEIVAREVESLPPRQRQRLHPFINGFNPTDQNAVEHIERMLKWRPGFWQGIGEVLTRHDSLTALTEGEQARADHPAMMKVYQLAARYDLPVIVHSNITSERERSPLYLGEIENALKGNPKTRIIWAHAGASNTLLRRQSLDFVLPELRQLLERYPNLYVLGSWSLRDLMIPEEGKADPQWIQLIKDYPDRFMLGSDLVGTFKNLAKALHGWDPVLDHLPASIAEKVAQTNMLKLLSEAEQTAATPVKKRS
ncbi:amidohydrolase family protein [Dongshaea marina]|uniref:amidohydrolase family protein n=1 Tax=Dongshaea marina TaxID=2047966 RepID=UPI0018FF18FE|nr:amidohydrolase family protein [Dongshaea marina]